MRETTRHRHGQDMIRLLGGRNQNIHPGTPNIVNGGNSSNNSCGGGGGGIATSRQNNTLSSSITIAAGIGSSINDTIFLNNFIVLGNMLGFTEQVRDYIHYFSYRINQQTNY